MKPFKKHRWELEEISDLSHTAVSQAPKERLKQLGDREKISWMTTTAGYRTVVRSGSYSGTNERTEENDIAAEEQLDTRNDSLDSLEDLDLVDVEAIDDNWMQDIIEEVMTEKDGAMVNKENVHPHPQANFKMKEPKLVIPKLAQAVLAPKERCPLSTVPIKQKKRGRPRKNDMNILKPATTVYKKTLVPAKNEPEFKTEASLSIDLTRLPPVLKVNFTEAETVKKPLSVDNPRKYRELEAAETGYIGNMERTFQLFDELGMTEPKNDRDIKYMKKLDDWGVIGRNNTHHFDGFDRDERNLMKSDLGELGVPDDWEDEELFEYLDSRTKAESVFRRTWLPKLPLKAPKPNHQRSLSKRDPHFNSFW